MTAPNIVHFIWLTGPKARPFSYINRIAVMAAADVQKPSRIIMWCNEEPMGNEHWDAVKHLFEFRRVSPPVSIGGEPLQYVQYQADVLRLWIIMQRGGIYIDTDSLLLRPLTPLMDEPFTLARESKDSIAMAPIIAEPEQLFPKLWLERLPAALRDDVWANHAVNLPHELCDEYSSFGLCDVRPQHEFFPLDLKRNYLMEEKPDQIEESLTRIGDAYAIHVYETYWRDYIGAIGPEYMKTRDSLFTRLFGKYA